jgi:hypothetical protein
VVNAQPENHDSPPGQETIYSGSVQDSEDPFIIVQGPDDTNPTSGEGNVLVVWKLAAFLVRPRLRLQNPSVVFAATASLKPAEQIEDATLKEEYLPSQVPSGINLLEVSSFLNLGSHIKIMFEEFGRKNWSKHYSFTRPYNFRPYTDLSHFRHSAMTLQWAGSSHASLP